MFNCLGNPDTDPSVLGDVMTEMPALFYSQLGEEFFRIDAADSLPSEGRRHAVANGYHFLSVNPARYWTPNGYEKSTLDWLDGNFRQSRRKIRGNTCLLRRIRPCTKR
mgnify:CR=1 FL=1